MYLQDEVKVVDHREDFYRTERDYCSYHEMREREDRDEELTY